VFDRKPGIATKKFAGKRPGAPGGWSKPAATGTYAGKKEGSWGEKRAAGWDDKKRPAQRRTAA
jgi:hypothetical protein